MTLPPIHDSLRERYRAALAADPLEVAVKQTLAAVAAKDEGTAVALIGAVEAACDAQGIEYERGPAREYEVETVAEALDDLAERVLGFWPADEHRGEEGYTRGEDYLEVLARIRTRARGDGAGRIPVVALETVIAYAERLRDETAELGPKAARSCR